MNIRETLTNDESQIRQIHLNAFAGEEGSDIADLAIRLLLEGADTDILSLAVESGGKLVGHTVFSPVRDIETKYELGQILAPLAVVPEYQGKGLGSMLVREGLRRLTERGDERIFVYGDPEYYKRFGFDHQSAKTFLAPFELSQPIGWLGQTLRKVPGQPVSGKLECVKALSRPDLW